MTRIPTPPGNHGGPKGVDTGTLLISPIDTVVITCGGTRPI